MLSNQEKIYCECCSVLAPTLLEDLQDGVAERFDLLAGQLAELSNKHQAVIGSLDVARGEASEGGKAMRAAVAAATMPSTLP